MKWGCALLLCFICIAVSVQGYIGKGYHPLENFLKSQMTKNSVEYVTEDVKTSIYSSVYIGNQLGLKEADKILKLPGQPDVSFNQYSGYITVDPNAGRALFYYFTESLDSSTKPLVLWLNGGPGCSSFGTGAMTELGPFRVNPDGKTLWYNENSWNNLANILFLESPAGVGFSYSNTTSDYITGDSKTAADSYTFLVNWFKRFPEYKTRDFYITGESYAGHYVPQLAALILQNNKITNQTVINLKGIAIGNAYIDYVDQSNGLFNYLWTHALISDEIHEGILQNCNFPMGFNNLSSVCQYYTTEAFNIIGNIYHYDIYAPLCSLNSSSHPASGFDPCSGKYAESYLNMPEVQKALHANITGNYNSCNLFVNSNWKDNPLSVLPVIKQLMVSGIRVWIYSGDTDRAVPVTTTKNSLPKLSKTVKTPWYAWYNQGEVGGYTVEYENITFVTIRGAGHLVPSYQPERALVLFSSFLDGKLPPRSIS